MEVIHAAAAKTSVRAMIFDFDGTISTLRCGWEDVMGPLFYEILSEGNPTDTALREKISAYIDESTGIQTIFQMKWLRGEVEKSGRTPLDIWEYKRMYNDRLMRDIRRKLAALSSGTPVDNYLIAGAKSFLEALRARGVKLYAASGTDDPDVKNEAQALGVAVYFDEIKGAPPHEEGCSKEAVLRRLLSEGGFSGGELAVCGDGKVEIALGKEAGARAIGIASNERARRGVDEKKRTRLLRAGADVIVGDFLEQNALLEFLGLS